MTKIPSSSTFTGSCRTGWAELTCAHVAVAMAARQCWTACVTPQLGESSPTHTATTMAAGLSCELPACVSPITTTGSELARACCSGHASGAELDWRAHVTPQPGRSLTTGLRVLQLPWRRGRACPRASRHELDRRPELIRARSTAMAAWRSSHVRGSCSPVLCRRPVLANNAQKGEREE
jgi:hypothetical protein